LAAGPVQAVWLLASGQTRFVAGGRIEVQVVGSGAEGGLQMPERLTAQLAVGERNLQIELKAEPGPAPTAGAARGYSAVLPVDIEGLATLSLTAPASTRLLIEIARPSVPEFQDALARMRGAEEQPQPTSGKPKAEPALASHEPMYFLVGTRGNTTARFQISFKYRVFDPDGPIAEFLPPLAGLRFAYTQNSIWDLGENSKPFRDTSYRPSFFYQWGTFEAQNLPQSYSVQAGFEHESNGKDGDRSRSVNTLFLRPMWRVELSERLHFAAIPKLWGYLDKSDNPDIQRYRGYADLHLRFGDDNNWLATTNLRHGTGGFGSAQIDLSYRLKRSLFADAGGFLHFQYFNGYGESLLDYNVRRRPQFRIGFSIVR
jgi:outer membrane phospholipase A